MKLHRLTLRAVLKNEKGEVLLLRRPPDSKYFPGHWELPGGKVDDGEHFIDALVREIKEEAGFNTEPVKVLGATELDLPEHKTCYIFFEVKVLSGQFQMSHEHDAFAWMSKDELKEAKVPPQLRDIVLSLAA